MHFPIIHHIYTVVGFVVFMFKLSWRLSLVTVVGLPVTMVVVDLYGEYYKVGMFLFGSFS